MEYSFKEVKCNNCGWCCKRAPCPVAIYLGNSPVGTCSFLKETAPEIFNCGLIMDEKDLVKQEALKVLILAGEGCTHKYGPHPVSLLKDLINRGLTPKHAQWEQIKAGTYSEFLEFAQSSPDPDSILAALNQFHELVISLEQKSI